MNLMEELEREKVHVYKTSRANCQAADTALHKAERNLESCKKRVQEVQTKLREAEAAESEGRDRLRKAQSEHTGAYAAMRQIECPDNLFSKQSKVMPPHSSR